jgi:hypothetical protein
MSKKKQPFIGFTEEEIFRAEANSYVILIGNDFYSKDGDFAFSKQQAEKYYDILMENILRTLDEGTEKQRIAAMKCLARLQILPLRVQ